MHDNGVITTEWGSPTVYQWVDRGLACRGWTRCSSQEFGTSRIPSITLNSDTVPMGRRRLGIVNFNQYFRWQEGNLGVVYTVGDAVDGFRGRSYCQEEAEEDDRDL